MAIDNEDDLEKLLNDDENNDDNQEGHSCSNPQRYSEYLLDIIKNKSKTLIGFISSINEVYRGLEDDVKKNREEDNRRKETWILLKHLMDEVKMTIDQYDYLLALHENEEESEDGEN